MATGTIRPPRKKAEPLILPVVTAGAEYLVMGFLMRRNILAYKAPQNHEGYDLICIHPDPRHRVAENELPQVRVQVKSRYATDCNRGAPIRAESFDALDFVVVAFLNIGDFYGEKDHGPERHKPEFYTLPKDVAQKYRGGGAELGAIKLNGLERGLEQYKDEQGFEQIAKVLGIPKPSRPAKGREC